MLSLWDFFLWLCIQKQSANIFPQMYSAIHGSIPVESLKQLFTFLGKCVPLFLKEKWIAAIFFLSKSLLPFFPQ